jgi:hypothetical protein
MPAWHALRNPGTQRADGDSKETARSTGSGRMLDGWRPRRQVRMAHPYQDHRGRSPPERAVRGGPVLSYQEQDNGVGTVKVSVTLESDLVDTTKARVWSAGGR